MEVGKRRLLRDNGFSNGSGDLAEWLQDKGMKHLRGARYHPQTHGMIERGHQTLKTRILLENYFRPGDFEAQIETVIDHDSHQRYDESLTNVIAADGYFERDTDVLQNRERIEPKRLEPRRLHHRKRAACSNHPDEPNPLLNKAPLVPETLTTATATTGGRPLSQRGVVAGPVHRAVAGGLRLGHGAYLATGIDEVNPSKSEVCDNVPNNQMSASRALPLVLVRL